jgi:hypothetical protein
MFLTKVRKIVTRDAKSPTPDPSPKREGSFKTRKDDNYFEK